MFRSATARITLAVVAVTMAISLLFSLAIYHFAAGAIQYSARRQYQRLRRVYTLPPPFHQAAPPPMGTEQIDAAHHLAWNLFYLNLIILAASGVIGYYWARQTLEPLEKAMELQGQFAADASHELRTPLAAMRSEIEVTLRGKQISEKESRALLASNLEEIAKLEGLAGGLLQLARLESAFSETEAVAINQIVTNAIKSLSAQAKTLKTTIEHTGSSFTVNGDKDSLVQAITILLDNALKYGKTGGKITVTTKTAAHRGLIIVADDGPGISADDLPHVFERFWRASASRSKNHADGFGLGLAIAKEIVNLHHGDIRADSVGGQGARFTVELPLA